MSHDAWATGLFEGEGSITLCRNRVRLQLKMTDEVVVRRFASVIGRGKVYGPYQNRSYTKDGYARADFWLWVLEGDEECAEVIARMRPWLSVRRLERFEEVSPREND